jgi:hypothetical protein
MTAEGRGGGSRHANTPMASQGALSEHPLMMVLMSRRFLISDIATCHGRPETEDAATARALRPARCVLAGAAPRAQATGAPSKQTPAEGTAQVLPQALRNLLLAWGLAARRPAAPWA